MEVAPLRRKFRLEPQMVMFVVTTLWTAKRFECCKMRS